MLSKTNLFRGLLFICFLFPINSFAKKESDPPKGEGKKIIGKIWDHALQTGKSKKKYFPEMASPFYFDGKIFVGTHSSLFYALNAANGKTLWQFKSQGPIASKPVADDHHVYFGNNKGMVYALDIQTGEKIWEHYVGGEILAQPALGGGSLYVVTTSREVYALDTATGKEVWYQFVRGFENKFTMRGTTPVTFDKGRLYIGFADGQVVSLSSANGAISWTNTFSKSEAFFKDVDSALLVDGNAIYVFSYSGYFLKLEKGSGRVIWEKEIVSGTDPFLDQNSLVITTQDGHVVCFDTKNGLRRWDVGLYSGTLSSPYVAKNYVVVGSADGRVTVLDLKNGTVLQNLKLPNGFLGIVTGSDQFFYFLSSGGKLQAYRVD